MSTNESLKVRAGETFTQVFEYQQPDGTPVDLTESVCTFRVINRATGVDIHNQTIDGDVTGVIRVHIEDEETATWTPGVHAYALEIENSSGDITRLIGGRFTVRGMHNV